MSSKIRVSAQARQDVGKGASRRLRRTSRVPGIMYGGEGETQMVSLDSNELHKAAHSEAFFSQVIEVLLDGAGNQVVVRDVQRNPVRDTITHIDFYRVSADRVIEVHVPLHFINEEACVGVKIGGGLISHNLSEVIISSLPANLPEYIEVDLKDLQLGQSLHLSDLKLPEGVEIPELKLGSDHNQQVVSVQAPRGGAEAEAEPAKAAAT
ncbi:MAG: 50S ribosomal protein L25/general stress protein Ctc [Gammaproteobacteria bacterium]|nr:50S ribosomal protein L25/general stress protein Ctc [Gammaproteobacteria bacterium]